MNKKIIVLLAVITVVIATIYLCTHKSSKTTNQTIDVKNEEAINIQEKQYLNNLLIEPVKEEELEPDLIGRLEIEKINLNAPIKQGTTNEILKDYVGHIEETAIYDGNIGLAAHNRGNKYSYFSQLNKLEKGDLIRYTTIYGTKEYIVEQKNEILETDWSIFNNSSENVITMITCVTDKPEYRLCVQAKLKS